MSIISPSCYCNLITIALRHLCFALINGKAAVNNDENYKLKEIRSSHDNYILNCEYSYTEKQK